MDQLQDLSDNRLVRGCIYCGGAAETRDHVPSRILLEPPYPENLPVVGACGECNQGFSLDEQYLICLLEAVLAGSAEPERIGRPSVARTLERSSALRAKIESSRKIVDGRIVFEPEGNRILNVVLKLAKGHAAFELSQICSSQPDHYWYGPLESLSEDQRDSFNSSHIQHLLGEIGSRGLQRLLVAELKLLSDNGEPEVVQVLVNDWVEVQEGCYRFLAIEDVGAIVIRIVISEYLGCEVVWRTDT